MSSTSPMYRAFVEVVPEASGFTGALTGQVAASSATAGAAGGKAAAGGMLAGFGKAIPWLAAGLTAFSLADVFADSVGNASDYQQSVAAVEDVFGGASGAVIKFADTADKAFGLSANQALVGARNFGVFGRAAGLTGTDLSTFSTDLLGLGADLAAFGNTTPEEAVTALSAALRGENEPIQKYGVLLNDAALRARALEMGIYDGNGALTAQQKVLAANAEIWAQTGMQQGQAAEEMDSLAGMQNQLASSWTNISTEIGTAFMPIAEALTSFVITELVPALKDFAAWLGSPEVAEGFASVVEGWNEAKPTFDAIVKVIGGVVDLIAGVFTLDFGKAWGGIVNIFTGAGEMIVASLQGWWNSLLDFIEPAVAWLAGIFNDLGPKISTALANAGMWLYTAGRDIIGGLINGITSMLGSIYKAITDTVGGAIDWAKDLLGIHSPSRVFHEIGAYTGQGFAAGISSQYRSVQSATTGLTGAAVAGTGTSFTFNGGITAYDPREVANEIETVRRRSLVGVI